MKKQYFIIAAALLTLLLSCFENNGKDRQSLEEVSKQELATALQERDELLALVKEVSAGLEQIKQLENVMTIAATNPNENTGKRSRILSDISSLKEKIQQRREMLQNLESKLQNSTINNKELHETIEALRIQIDSQMAHIESLNLKLIAANRQIGMLNNTVDSLSTTMTAVAEERDAAQDTSTRLENELNTCHYVVASKSELKKHNILESGFLRNSKLMKGDFDKDFFITGDKRTLTYLPLKTKKAKILSNHPEKSYEIIERNDQKIIKITNPDMFWSLTNYCVVQK